MVRYLEVHPVTGYEVEGAERATDGPFLYREDVQLVIQALHHMATKDGAKQCLETLSLILGVEVGSS